MHLARAFLLSSLATACMPAADPGEAAPADARAGQLSAPAFATAAKESGETGLRTLAGRAQLYVPASYRHGRPMPLLVMLHGAGGNASQGIALARGEADRLGFLLLGPKSRAASWDMISARAFGPDVRAIDALLREVASGYSVDPARVAIGGFSDGASYALTIGLINGGLFSEIFAFAPGFAAPGAYSGKPRVFISHGTADRVLPIDACSRRIVPHLRRAGYDVRYEEFAGGHEVPRELARQALSRLAEAR